MSRQENTPNRSQQGPTTAPVSRITRTNPNSNQRLISNSSLITESAPSTEELVKLSHLPNKPSLLDKNIVFQDMDHTRSSTYQSTNASRANNGPTSTPMQGEKAMGLITNVFLGSTSKFVRGGINNAPTPAKIEQPEQPPQDMNKGTPAKFSRSKEVEQKSRTISMKEPPQEVAQATDRSMETAKKIERRQGANRETRELKFAVEKKEQKIESTPEKVVVSARRYEATKVQTVKTEVAKPEQPVEDFPRVYQAPIQRQNPYARSRIVSEQQAPPATTVITQPAQQKPKEEPVAPAKPINRLVQSRMQNQLSESKVSERQVKPATNLNRGAESRLIEESIVAEPVVHKQEVKPKPYSRSFINRKSEPQPQATNNQSTINQSAVRQSPRQPPRAVQQSKITEVKAKPQEKEILPEASDVKVILKKSGCIALICKRLLRSRLEEGFSFLKNQRRADKVKKTNECQIVCYASTTIVKAKETNLLKVSFEAIKRKFSTAYIVSLKSYADQTPANHKNAGVMLLDYLYCSKMRANFKILKTMLERLRNKAKCMVVIESFYKQKVKDHMKRSFENIKIRQKTNVLVLNNLSNVFNSANKIKLSSAFSKIASVKPIITKVWPSPIKPQAPQRSRITSKIEQPAPVVNDTSNQALIEKLDKLKKVTSAVQGEITTIQSSIAKKKKTTQNEKSSLLEKVTLLKHQNQQVNNEIQIKKHRSGQIKQEMETIPKKHRELQEELTQPPQNKLELLTNIYISHFKNTEETISTADLQSAYNLKVEDGSVLFHEWASILKNVQLKRIIAAYQGVDPRDNKGRANLISEQTLISRLIRSYVKQQYFWQWIHLSAQNA